MLLSRGCNKPYNQTPSVTYHSEEQTSCSSPAFGRSCCVGHRAELSHDRDSVRFTLSVPYYADGAVLAVRTAELPVLQESQCRSILLAHGIARLCSGRHISGCKAASQRP